MPAGFRVQMVHIWKEVLGDPQRQSRDAPYSLYMQMVGVLRREHQVFKLSKGYVDPNDRRHAHEDFIQGFLEETDADRAIDYIELSSVLINTATRDFNYLGRNNFNEIADDAIKEINERFQENGLGYRFEDNRIHRIDSELIHSEVVVPALRLLMQSGYENAQKEFLEAHEHFRHRKNSQALVDCNKAFESVMKIICDKRGWAYPTTATTSVLVGVLFTNKFIPDFYQHHFSGLKNVLESAIATPRNKAGGHGAGTQQIYSATDALTAYVLHITASTIVFLAELERSNP